MPKKNGNQRRAESGLEAPNLNKVCGMRNLVLLERFVGEGRNTERLFVSRHPELEKTNPFGDPYTVDAAKLTWIDTVAFERMLLKDARLKRYAERLAKRRAWSPSLAHKAELAVMRVYRTVYLPWLLAKFTADVKTTCAEYALIALCESIRGKMKAKEWERFRKLAKLPEDYLKRPIEPRRKKKRRRDDDR